MHSPTFAPSAERVPVSRIRALADVAFGMADVLSLQFGESTLPTPPYVIEAVNRAAQEGWTYYSPNQGLPSLRDAIANLIARLHAVEIDPSEIQVNSGGVQALNLAIKCVVDPGDEAIVLSPNWPNGSAMVEMFGARAVEVPMARAGQRFMPDVEAMESAVTARTRLLLYASPSNPLGWTATVAEQQMLLDFARQHGLWLLTDEVYERIYYGGQGRAEGGLGQAGSGQIAPSILKLSSREDAVIVVNSFSKTYCMTGWRLGWMVSRADFVQKAAQLNEFIVSHAPTMIQRGGEAAIAQGEDDIAAMVEEFQERRDFCAGMLREVSGVNLPEPEGAFYLFPQLEGIDDSYQFSLDLLRKTHVAVAPGSAFGNGGEGSIRICYAPGMDVLKPAMERICEFIASYGGVKQ
ncbi:MAG: aminotransferase class I/II-fold pyridoxal phosphate-dependent enzyme [Caldilineaceae bacterium SB0668_bin_21]|nr:aminotransferase class I/II-fold pyridoxal phosphate-dependent enzyme [Caldilineaceae bacterium SB0668_bin_21]MYC21386.1 aminotransferase class I/II-fold pyridoxal phosphate-dependent enzyme [Caldilineaceae bacterium SB0662_bin_25]